MTRVQTGFLGLGLIVGLITSSADAASIVVSFGFNGADQNNLSALTGDGLNTITYNRVRGNAPVAGIANLSNTAGSLTGIGIAPVTGSTFASNNNANSANFGPSVLTSPGDAIFPDAVGTEAVYVGNSVAQFVAYTFSNLDPSGGTSYTFDLLAARNAGGPRTSMFTVTGANAGTGSIESAFNTGNLVHIADITPTASGTIELRLSNKVGEYAFMNGVQVTTAAVPEPASLGALALGSLVLIARRRRTA